MVLCSDSALALQRRIAGASRVIKSSVLDVIQSSAPSLDQLRLRAVLESIRPEMQPGPT